MHDLVIAPCLGAASSGRDDAMEEKLLHDEKLDSHQRLFDHRRVRAHLPITAR